MQKIVSLQQKPTTWYADAIEKMVQVVQNLSHAKDIETITFLVRNAARELTGADGATFVLREGDQCYYADENAISPLWKGQRFPMSRCVSGWVMINAVPAVIENIYDDARVPAEAYRPTFVKSMLMVPIREEEPIGAIGNYWAKNHLPTQEEISILQTLANVTAVAVENLRLHTELEKKISALENTKSALGDFVWIASHNLQAPLRAINDIIQWVDESLQRKQYDDTKEHIKSLKGRIGRMERLLKDILEYSQIDYILDPHHQVEKINGTHLVHDAIELANIPQEFDIQINDTLKEVFLPRMPLQQVFSALINNAVSYNKKKKDGVVTIDCEETETEYIFTISDNGPGIAPAHQDKIFEMLHSMKSAGAREGLGLSLALIKKTLAVYGGKISVSSILGQGSIFKFTWPIAPSENRH